MKASLRQHLLAVFIRSTLPNWRTGDKYIEIVEEIVEMGIQSRKEYLQWCHIGLVSDTHKDAFGIRGTWDWKTFSISAQREYIAELYEYIEAVEAQS
tara:strand:- start:48 stop:338 length:291 start_codon:yes stop_codon:yes gene_type:complete